MAKTTVRTDGFRELERALSDIAKHTTRRAVGRRALRAAADPIRDRAEQLAPDDARTAAPLDLKSSIVISARQKSGRATQYRAESKGEVVLHIGPTRDGYPQAIMQEFGTRHHPAKPYMRPAWDGEGGEKAIGRIGKALGEEVDKAAARAARKAAKVKL